MRKFFGATILALLLLSASLTSVSARPGGAELAAQRVHVTQVGSVTHVTIPDQIDCSGHRTFWYSVFSPYNQFNDYALSAGEFVLLDYYTSAYCGEAYTSAQDILSNNCHRFDGKTYDTYTAAYYSTFSVYHCTAGHYTFYGAETAMDCPSTNYYLLQSFNWDDANQGTLTEVVVDCQTI